MGRRFVTLPRTRSWPQLPVALTLALFLPGDFAWTQGWNMQEADSPGYMWRGLS